MDQASSRGRSLLVALPASLLLGAASANITIAQVSSERMHRPQNF